MRKAVLCMAYPNSPLIDVMNRMNEQVSCHSYDYQNLYSWCTALYSTSREYVIQQLGLAGKDNTRLF